MKNFVNLDLKHSEPEDVYLYFSHENSAYLFDEEVYYAKDEYFYKHIKKELEDGGNYVESIIKNNNEHVLNGEYYLFSYLESIVPSHNYGYVLDYLGTYGLYDRSNVRLLALNTNDIFYNRLLEFFESKILINPIIERLEIKKLYKIKKINIIKYLKNKNQHNTFLKYSNILKEKLYIESTNINKSYNIKFNNSNHCWTPARSFEYTEKTESVLQKNNYKKMPNDCELNKQIVLQNSRVVILSWGGNSHINLVMSSYGQKKYFLILCHESYKIEYERDKIFKENEDTADYFRFGNHVRYVKNLNFDEFDKIIFDFESKYNLNTQNSEIL